MSDMVSPFSPQFSSSRNARIEKSHLVGSTYAAGYFLGAHFLTVHVRKDGADRDSLVFPICYLHRHNIELNLKQVISTAHRVFGTAAPQVSHHRIADLWPLAKQLLRQAEPGSPDPQEFKKVDLLIEYLSKVDHDAQAFRFPSRTNGCRSLDDVKEIDLDLLADMATAATFLLWGCIDWLDDLGRKR